MEFELKPYVGALPITFEMDADAVKKCIGAPGKTQTIDGELRESRPQKRSLSMPLHVDYSAAGKVVEIEFQKGSVLTYKGTDLFKQRDLIRFLAADDRPKSFMGTIIFLNLGISTGPDEPRKTINVFAKGRFDPLLKKLVDYKPE